MRYAARTDLNQAEIVESLRDMGCTVELLHRVGGGCPDILVGFRDRNVLLEIKQPKGRLNKLQRKWHALWKGQVAVVRSPEDALRVVGLI